MKYTDPELLEVIDNNQYTFSLDKLEVLARQSLEREAQDHSNRMEHPEPREERRQRIRRQDPVVRGAKKDKRKDFRRNVDKTLAALEHAWDMGTIWLYDSSGHLKEEHIKDLARLIEPENPSVQFGYRREGARAMDIDPIVYPRYEKIDNLMYRLLLQLNSEEEELHPVDKGILAHMHIALIHPFSDGNGRLARLVQNLILDHYEYAPALLKSGEKSFYQERLKAAQQSYRARMNEDSDSEFISPDEAEFFHYMATRVNVALEHGIDMLSQLPEFRVELLGRQNPRDIFSMRRRFKDYFRHGAEGQVTLDQSARTFTLRGEITAETIQSLVVGKRNQYAGKFTIQPLDE